jgi:hypothetical protein
MLSFKERKRKPYFPGFNGMNCLEDKNQIMGLYLKILGHVFGQNQDMASNQVTTVTLCFSTVCKLVTFKNQKGPLNAKQST